MKVEPGGEELLRVARETLLETLLPRLPAESHYTARMVANAIAIAARDLAHPLDGDVDADAMKTLAADIRAGRHDANPAGTIERLREITRARLAVSNPRILPTKGP